jgi:hypothetical protein
MAEHGTVTYDVATSNDYGEHERTYRFFVGFTKYGTLAVAIALILMAIFLL